MSSQEGERLVADVVQRACPNSGVTKRESSKLSPGSNGIYSSWTLGCQNLGGIVMASIVAFMCVIVGVVGMT